METLNMIQARPYSGNDNGAARNERPRDRKARLRREARSLAMKVMFEADLTPHDALDILLRSLADEEIEEETSQYAERLVRGVFENRDVIDAIIADAAPAFPVEQLPTVDRNILRVAVQELRGEPGVPVKTTINEAIDIAKEFGGENSGRFVNGVLGTIAEGLARDDESGDR